MYYWSGGLIFFLLAILLVVAFVRVKKRDRDYGEGKSEHHDEHSDPERYPTGRTTPKGQHPKGHGQH
jgi:hypothetical protein